MSAGHYPFVLYCACGVSFQYTDVPGQSRESRALADALFELHQGPGHEQVSAQEARAIRLAEGRRLNPPARRGRRRLRLMPNSRARSTSRTYQGRRRPWHAVVLSEVPDGRLRTACGQPVGQAMLLDTQHEFEPGDVDACETCRKRLEG